VTYGDWPLGCLNGKQYRNVISSKPADCVLTEAQKSSLSKTCGQTPVEAVVAPTPVISINKPAVKPVRKLNLSNKEIVDIMAIEKKMVTKPDPKFTKQYSGRILSQTAYDNRLWYLYPGNQKRYYINQISSINWAIGKFGVKFNDQLLNRIPVGGLDYILLKDSDADGLSDDLEAKIGTNRLVKDTDDDGYTDGEEIKSGFNPVASGPITEAQKTVYDQAIGLIGGSDLDADGLSDELEQAIGTNKNKKDSDGDGYSDGSEVATHNNPLGKGKLVNSKAIIDKNKGLILISSKGQAWYVNPADGKRYFLGSNKLEVLRRTAVAVNNEQIRKIKTGD
jgi:hypothetical protein